MKHRIEIKELCQSNNISSKEQAELIIKEIKNALELIGVTAPERM